MKFTKFSLFFSIIIVLSFVSCKKQVTEVAEPESFYESNDPIYNSDSTEYIVLSLRKSEGVYTMDVSHFDAKTDDKLAAESGESKTVEEDNGMLNVNMSFHRIEPIDEMEEIEEQMTFQVVPEDDVVLYNRLILQTSTGKIVPDKQIELQEIEVF